MMILIDNLPSHQNHHLKPYCHYLGIMQYNLVQDTAIRSVNKCNLKLEIYNHIKITNLISNIVYIAK